MDAGAQRFTRELCAHTLCMSMCLGAFSNVSYPWLIDLLNLAHQQYNAGYYSEAMRLCEQLYESDAYRTDNLLLLGALHFQMGNFSESIFYNQQCIRVDPNFAEAYGNLGNALKEIGDIMGATEEAQRLIETLPG